MNLLDIILLHIFPKYTYKVYRKGVMDEFNWMNKKKKFVINLLLTNGVLQGLTRLRKKLENLAIAIKTRNINDAHKYAKNTILILAEIFKLTQLNTTQWLITIAISIAPIIIVELQKKFNELKFGKVVYDYKTRQEV